MWTAAWRNGPLKRFASLKRAAGYVERTTPLKRGWTGTWDVRTPQTRFYVVRNSRGTLVHQVIVQRSDR